MVKILMVSVHPAPYLDKLKQVLSSCQLSFIYFTSRSNEKLWSKEYGDFSIDLSFSFGNIRRIHRSLLSSDIIVLSSWNYYFKFIYLYTLAIVFRKKVLFFSDHPIKPIQRNSLQYYIKCQFLNSFDGILCASISTKLFYLRSYPLSSEKLFHFPYVSSFNECVKSSAFNGRISVLVANRFIARKGYDLILHLLKYLEDNRSDSYHFDILGDGELLHEFRNFKFENVKLHGWVEYDVYLDFLKRSDIFIHASEEEPYGIPPVDAFAAGLKLLISDRIRSFDIEEVKWENYGVHKFKATDKQDFLRAFLSISNSDGFAMRNQIFDKYFSKKAFYSFESHFTK